MGMIETGLVALRDKGRLAEITSTLLRYGFDDLLSRIGLRTSSSGSSQSSPHASSAPERLRLALEELGPTFTKLGQVLSTRGDLLGLEWTRELEKLQSHVRAEPWENVHIRLSEDLGAPPEDVFAGIEPDALAAGSIAQVHRATLKDGTQVVVKIRREGLRPRIEADMRLLSHLAQLAESRWEEAQRFRLREILNQLGSALQSELDLSAEGRNCDAIAANMASRDDIHIPRIFHAFGSERLLVQEFMEGMDTSDPSALAAAGLDGPTLAERGASAFLEMTLVHGLFHADPHPGNLRALPGNHIGFIDFGMVGQIGGRRREQLLLLLSAIVDQSGDRVAALLLDWSAAHQIDISKLEADCDLFVLRHSQPPLNLGAAVNDILSLARSHALTLPPDLTLLFKALITADGVMRALDPDFDAIRVAEPIVRREMRRQFSPMALAGHGKSLALDMAELSRNLPSLIRLAQLRLRQGRIAADVELKELHDIGKDIRWAAIRVAVAIVTAAFALGLSPRLLNYGPVLSGLPLGTWLGLASIIAGLIWLVFPRR